MSDATAMIETSGLRKNFGNVKALVDLDLTVPSGIFGFIGPNGAGKTTLLRILLGLIKADSGRAEVLGLDSLAKSLEIRRRVGVLHEKPLFFPTMKVIDYLDKVRRIYRSSQESTDLLMLVGLDYAKDRRIGDLSAGMHQRLGLAQALIGNPELVFLDEPTSNLDVDGRDEIIRLVVDINSMKGVSFFISSHILSEVERVCHHIAFIKRGKIIETGPVRDIIRRKTQSTFRVICSNPQQLHDALRPSSSVLSAVVSGANSVTIVSRESEISALKKIIDEIADKLEIKVYEIVKASTLEDAYREAMRDE